MSGTVELDRDGRTLLISFPYREDLVDVVRTLPGRRWDRGSKLWRVPATQAEQVAACFMPHGFQIAPEVTSIMAGTTAIAEKEEKPKANAEDADGKGEAAEGDAPRPLTVRELNEQARSALQAAFPARVQVIGEVLNFDKNRDRKHIFFSLVEKASSGNKVEANVDVALFERTAQRLIPELERQGLSLRDGIEILVEARVDLYPASGRYQLIIETIKPEFTLGKLALSREQILAELREKDLEEKNKRLPFPAPMLRIAVLTSPDSDGWNDFRKEVEASGIGFTIGLFPVKVQGEALRPTVLAGLRWFAERADEWDVLCILRGGGSRTDLAWFDDRDVAMAVAQHPLKIVCGIGHQRDQSVLDHIAHSAKTPTAVGSLLCELHRAETELLDERQERLLDLLRGALDREQRRLADRAATLRRVLAARLAADNQFLQEAARRLLRGTRHRIRTCSDALQRAEQVIGAGTRSLLRRERHDVQSRSERLQRGLRSALRQAGAQLETRAARQRLLDPRQVLQRGYCIVRDESGSVLTETGGMQVGQRLTLDLRDGSADTRVEEIRPRDDD